MSARKKKARSRGREVRAIRKELEEKIASGRMEHYSLTLYVAGMTSRSALAIQTIREFCDERLAGRHDLEVVDIYRDPERAREEQVLAAPTLVRKLPLPLRRLIGDMSDRGKVLVSLDIRDDHDAEPKRARPSQG